MRHVHQVGHVGLSLGFSPRRRRVVTTRHSSSRYVVICDMQPWARLHTSTAVLRSTKPCIHPGSVNRVLAAAGAKAGMSALPGGRQERRQSPASRAPKRVWGHVASVKPETPKAWSSRRRGSRRRRRRGVGNGDGVFPSPAD